MKLVAGCYHVLATTDSLTYSAHKTWLPRRFVGLQHGESENKQDARSCMKLFLISLVMITDTVVALGAGQKVPSLVFASLKNSAQNWAESFYSFSRL